MIRLTVAVLGRTLLDVGLGQPAAPAGQSPVDSATGPITLDPGPVTDRRTTAVLGFAPQQPGVRRCDRNDPAVIR